METSNTTYANIDPIKQFSELFNGRTDAYGSWDGGCVHKPVTPATWTRHLWGAELIGIYPATNDNMVKWGCSDIDITDITLARNLQLALQIKNIHSWIEQTVKGFHVWVFAEDWVPSWKMRKAIILAHSVIQLAPKEVNPKQDTIQKLGNYVRLPYPGALLEMPITRFMIDSNNEPISIMPFLESASKNLVSESTLTEIVGNFQDPKTEYIQYPNTTNALSPSLNPSLSPYATKIFNDGPLPGSDRSSTLVRLAYHLRTDGLQAETAFSVIKEADRRWGKFYGRIDCDSQLWKIISHVYCIET